MSLFFGGKFLHFEGFLIESMSFFFIKKVQFFTLHGHNFSDSGEGKLPVFQSVLGKLIYLASIFLISLLLSKVFLLE